MVRGDVVRGAATRPRCASRPETSAECVVGVIVLPETRTADCVPALAAWEGALIFGTDSSLEMSSALIFTGLGAA